jgi:hypothetical protein
VKSNFDAFRGGQERPDYFSDPRIACYPLSERVAIVLHGQELAQRLGREPTLAETVESWEAGNGPAWRRDKFWRDRAQQFKEIEVHKYLESKRQGHDVGWEFAALDWIQRYAAGWRDWWEEHWWDYMGKVG